MIFHLGFDLPQAAPAILNHESPDLTREEHRILKDQIRKNGLLIDQYITRLDLFVNKEKYPRQGEVFIEKIRQRLFLLMEENDTFRKVLWKHFQREASVPAAGKE